MKHEFDRRWQAAAAAARHAREPAPPLEAPSGFATRVVAQARGAAPSAASTASVWQLFSLRALAAAALLLLIVGAYDSWAGQETSALTPGIEDAMGEQLPWFQP